MMQAKKINTALCSFGMSGKVFHAPFIDVHPQYELTAVWERSKSVVKDFYPNTKSYATYEELLKDETIDLVVVNTPNYTHFEYTQKALEANKHVLVEKPFTVTVAEAEALLKLAQSKNRVLAVYHNRRWDSDFLTVKKIVESGDLGTVVDAEIHFDRYKKDLSPKVHKETPGPGTGVLHDLGAHIIDSALQLFGKPEAVFADLRIIRPVSQVMDYMDVLLYYPSLRVRLKSSYLAKEPVPSFIIHGTEGSFLKTRADVQEAELVKGNKPNSGQWGMEPAEEEGLLHIEKEGKSIREKVPTLKGNYMELYNGLYEAIINNKPAPVTAEEALQIMQIIEAAFKSNETKKVIPLDE